MSFYFVFGALCVGQELSCLGLYGTKISCGRQNPKAIGKAHTSIAQDGRNDTSSPTFHPKLNESPKFCQST